MSSEDNSAQRLQAAFAEFLEDDSYRDRIEEMIEKNSSRLIISIDDLRLSNAELAAGLIKTPIDHLPPFQEALKTLMKNIDDSYVTSLKAAPTIGLAGNFGVNHVTPRCLAAHLFGNLICLEGIITKCYELRCKVVKSVHYAREAGNLMERGYSDSTSLSGKKTSTIYPKVDENNNPLVTEFGLSIYEDYQKITIQEMPERAPAGQLPRSVDVILSRDLVDGVKPGDRVRITGIYRAMPSKNGGGTSGVFKSIVLANYTEILVQTGTQISLTGTDVQNIKKFARTYKSKCFAKMAKSIAPSICGHDCIKKAVLAQLMGGLEKNLENGTHIRGDINIMLIGDPSTAKSQMLRSAMNIADLSIATTGRGSSGVGLTAAVLTDMDTGEKRLEAGAMVLADRGLVCIDEFDKMSDADRVAIHEVMEQQTVTINKAGIHTALNARCSVLAAANPVYGQYRTDLSTMENVALPDSLLSRFDLLFIVLDEIDPKLDRLVSEHVLSNHLYRPANEADGYVNPSFILDSDSLSKIDSDDEEEDAETAIFQKHNARLKGRMKNGEDRIVNLKFLRKYLNYAKKRAKPTLSPSSCQFICEAYATLRDDRRQKTLPITARTLETMIRLSTSIAKLRLGEYVTKNDATQAIELLKFALYGEEEEVEEDEHSTFNETTRKVKAFRKKRRRLKKRRDAGEDVDTDDETESEDGDMSDSSSSSSEEEDTDEEGESATPTRKQTKRGAIEKEAKSLEDDSGVSPKSKKGRIEEVEVSKARKMEFMAALSTLLTSTGNSISELQGSLGSLGFSRQETEVIMTEMDQEGKIIIDKESNTIYRT